MNERRLLSKVQQKNYIVLLEAKTDLMQKIMNADPETDTQEAKDYIAMIDEIVNAEHGTENWFIFSGKYPSTGIIFDVIGFPPEL